MFLDCHQHLVVPACASPDALPAQGFLSAARCRHRSAALGMSIVDAAGWAGPGRVAAGRVPCGGRGRGGELPGLDSLRRGPGSGAEPGLTGFGWAPRRSEGHAATGRRVQVVATTNLMSFKAGYGR